MDRPISCWTFSPKTTCWIMNTGACFERAQVMEYVAVRLREPLEWIWNRLIGRQVFRDQDRR